MSKPVAIITRFVLERLEELPLERRAELTRALAAVSASNVQRRALERMAHDLEDIQRRHEQLLFNFRKRKGTP